MSSPDTPLLSDRLFPHQAELPPLPLPELSDTLERYLKTVQPLLSEEEWAHTQGVVADFGREGGEGEELQVFLEEKASSERNWMEEWWEQLALAHPYHDGHPYQLDGCQPGLGL